MIVVSLSNEMYSMSYANARFPGRNAKDHSAARSKVELNVGSLTTWCCERNERSMPRLHQQWINWRARHARFA